MKKAIVVVVLLFTLILGFSFSFKTFVNATSDNDGKTVATIDGASIRTAEPLGLRFGGEVSEEFVGSSVEYGFLITKGTVTKSAIIERYAASTALAVDCGELDNNNRFYLSIVNFPSSEYKTRFTVLAYVSVDGEMTYADSVVSRSIFDVAEHEVTVNGSANEFVNKVYKSSTFVFNGGAFDITTKFEIGAINSGADGLSGITVCFKGNEASSFEADWYKVSARYSHLDDNLFEIVEAAATGVDLTDDDYDIVIAADVNNAEDYAALEALASDLNNYIKIGLIAYYGTDADLLLGGRLYLADGDLLPNATKNYYTFAGWFDNELLEGVAVTTKDGDDAEVFYAKYTPIEYHLTYDLQGGEVDGEDSLDSVAFTVESASINLPIASRMAKDGYAFVEWNTRADGSGDAITQISAGSHGDVTAYAIWQEVVEVSLSSADLRTFASVTPTKYVKSDFTAGTFIIDGNTYTVGSDHKLYSTIAAALADVSSNNEIIYVFAGTYTEATLTTPNYTGLKIIGPQYGIAVNVQSPARGDEACVADALITLGSGTSLDGLKFTTTTSISASGNNIAIKNCWFYTKGQSIPAAGYRLVLFVDNISNFVVEGCQFTPYINSSNNVTTLIASKDNGNYVNNARIANNYFYLSNSTFNMSYDIRFYNTSGLIDIYNNYFYRAYNGNGDLIYIGYVADTLNIERNEVNNSAKTARINIANVHNDSVINIVGNVFSNVSGDAIKLNTTYHPYLTISSNCFITKAQVYLTLDTTNLVAANNYYSNSVNNSVNSGTYSLSFTLVTSSSTDARNSTNASYCNYLIDSIGVVEYTEECHAKIVKAREFYDSLTNAVKNMVTRYSTLTTAESTYASLAG